VILWFCDSVKLKALRWQWQQRWPAVVEVQQESLFVTFRCCVFVVLDHQHRQTEFPIARQPCEGLGLRGSFLLRHRLAVTLPHVSEIFTKAKPHSFSSCLVAGAPSKGQECFKWPQELPAHGWSTLQSHASKCLVKQPTNCGNKLLPVSWLCLWGTSYCITDANRVDYCGHADHWQL